MKILVLLIMSLWGGDLPCTTIDFYSWETFDSANCQNESTGVVSVQDPNGAVDSFIVTVCYSSDGKSVTVYFDPTVPWFPPNAPVNLVWYSNQYEYSWIGDIDLTGNMCGLNLLIKNRPINNQN